MDKYAIHSKELTMPKSYAIPYFEAFFAVIVWGAPFIATKVALQDFLFG